MNSMREIAESCRRQIQPIVVLLSVSLIMSVLWYFGRQGFFRRELAGVFPSSGLSPLYPFMYLAACSVVLRFLLPMAIVLLVFRKSPRDFGFLRRTRNGGGWVYVALYLAMVPLVLLAARMDSFQAQYPRCGAIIDGTSIPLGGFLAYQLCYLLVFISGEAFWRGYVLFGLKPHFGISAIFVMVIPYTMQHFGKPFPETLGAVVTGTVLGWLALRRGDFWAGALLHYAVALTMDLLAVTARGLTFV